MPLFELAYTNALDFGFADGRLSIRPFSSEEFDLSPFAENDRYHLKHPDWAIVAESSDMLGYEEDVSLLIMTFRLMSDDISPHIIFRLLTEEPFHHIKLMEQLCHIRIAGEVPLLEIYSQAKLQQIDHAYCKLRASESLSIRVKNAFYFLYLALHTSHWSPSLMFYMSTLEALFSKDQRGSAAKTICRRVTNFLNSTDLCNRVDMEALYETRSRITHGNIVANEEPKENLLHLQKLEKIVVNTFRKFIAQDSFQHFKDPASRDQFMSTLD